MSKLRMFQKARHAVRLPALPRQVVMLVLLINIIGEWVNRTMRETAGQAAVLAQLTNMQDLTRRARCAWPVSMCVRAVKKILHRFGWSPRRVGKNNLMNLT
jgi:hypothetical protein